MKYTCDVCGWEYDEEVGYPEGGIAPGTKWEDVPEDFLCPLCSVGKEFFSKVEEQPEGIGDMLESGIGLKETLASGKEYYEIEECSRSIHLYQ